MQINFMFKTLHCIIYYLLFIQLYLIWLNIAVTSHLCKMSAATIQGQRLLQCNNDCRGYYLKTLLYTTRYLHRYKFS